MKILSAGSSVVAAPAIQAGEDGSTPIPVLHSKPF